jgi:hypothetical protein
VREPPIWRLTQLIGMAAVPHPNDWYGRFPLASLMSAAAD